MVSKIVWIFGVASAKVKVTTLNIGRFDEIFCHGPNNGGETLPAGTWEYTVGAVDNNEESSERSVRDMHQVMAGIEYTHGFSEISSLKVSGSYTFEHEESRKSATLSSSTKTRTQTLRVPELKPGKTWCAYRFATQVFKSDDSDFYFGFADYFYEDKRLNTEKQDFPVEIKGEELDLEDPRGFMLSTHKWGSEEEKGWFLYMQDKSDGNVRAWEGDPGPQGHWLLQSTGDGSYTMRTKKWSDWYLYMQDTKNGNMRAWSGEPGAQGHFVLTPHVSKPCFLISTKKWEKYWYMYMQDTSDGNVRGWEGNPGDQGCWQLKIAWTNTITV
jgi:hypothetical protein